MAEQIHLFRPNDSNYENCKDFFQKELLICTRTPEQQHNNPTAPNKSPDLFSHLLSSLVSSYPPSSSHSLSLSLFHPLFCPLWVCSLWNIEGQTITCTVFGMTLVSGEIFFFRNCVNPSILTTNLKLNVKS